MPHRACPAFAAPVVAALIWVALVPFLLPAAGSDENRLRQERYDLITELSIDDDTYRVVPGTIIAPEIPDNRRAALGGYLRIVRDVVANVPLRYLDEDERNALIHRRIATERNRLHREIDGRLLALDTEVLESGEAEDPQAADVRSGDSELRRLRRRLEILDSLAVDLLTVPREVRIEIPEDQTYLFRPSLGDPARLGAETEADLYLYITIDPLDDLYILEVHMYHLVLERERVILRIVAPPEEIPLRLEEYGRRIVHAVAAAEVADITVEAVDGEGMQLDHARIYLDDRLMGVGRVRDGYVPAGTYLVRAVTPDGREASRNLTVAPGEETTVPLVITAQPKDFITISTVPPAASVYRGVEWLGYTPLRIPLPDGVTSFSLVKEDYYDSRLELSSDSPPEIQTVLVARGFNWEEETRLSRDRFYRSFGLFSLSLGVPIILYGAYQDYTGLFPAGSARPDLSEEERQRVVSEGSMLFYGYYGGIALSAGFFGNMIWRLVDYIRTAQGYHTR